MSSMSVGRLSAMICIAVGLSIGLMKTLFPNVYDLIGSSCLVLVGMSLLAVCIIFCAIPYMQCCHARKSFSTLPFLKRKSVTYQFIPRYYLQLLTKSRLFLPWRSIRNVTRIIVSYIFLFKKRFTLKPCYVSQILRLTKRAQWTLIQKVVKRLFLFVS